jgi:hypothetical protein
MGRRRESLERGASSVHFGSRRDLDKLTSDPARCRAKSYDVVLNGTELGSGSIRIHRRDVQAKVFSALGFSDEEAKSASASCWKPWNTARRRMAESRWGWTVW